MAHSPHLGGSLLTFSHKKATLSPQDILASLDNIKNFVIIKLARELIAQGHRGSSKLIDSLAGTVGKIQGGFEIVITANHYYKFVDQGVRPSRVPYSGRRGRGGKSQYIQALIAYFKKKGAADPKAAAFATAAKHKKEGMPTRASFRFSKTGKRTEFIDEMLKKHEDNIFDQMAEQGFSDISSKIDKAFDKL